MAKLISINCASVAIMLTSATFFSCVNPDYDLSKGVDMDMTLLPNTSIPLGSMGSITVTDLLGNGSSVINQDNEGNLSLSFGGGASSTSFDIPDFNMGGEGGLSTSSGNTTVRFNTGLEESVLPPTIDEVDKEIHFSDLEQDDKGDDHLLRTHMDIEIDKEIPKEIKDIKIVNMKDAVLKYNFNVSEGGILHLKDGFTMEFPHYMTLERMDDDDRYEIIDEYIVRFKEDVRISASEPLTLEFWFRSVEGHEYDADGTPTLDLISMEPLYDENNKIRATHIFHTDALDIVGDLYLKYSDYIDAQIPLPTQVLLIMSVDMEHLDMTSGEFLLNVDMQMDSQQVEIGDLGSMFSGTDVTLDLYNPALRLSMNNNSPLEMDLTADITSFAGSYTETIHIGGVGTNAVKIPSEQEIEYCISSRGGKNVSNTVHIVEPKLTQLIKSMPESLEIHDMTIETEDKFVKVYSGDTFDLGFGYEFSTPLSFGRDFKLPFTYDLDLGMDSSMGFSSLLLSMNMKNTIPLNLHLSGLPLDAEGNEIADTSMELDVVIPAGSLDQPTVTTVEIAINDSSEPVSKLRLNIEATSSADIEGRVLNIAQGLDITDLAVTLPDGITLDLTADEEK